MNFEIVQVCVGVIKKSLKDLIGTTYTNKMYFLFRSLLLKNFRVKYV